MNNPIFPIIHTIFILIILSCHNSPDTVNADYSLKNKKKSDAAVLNPYMIYDQKTFNITNIKLLKYFSHIMNTTKTLRAHGGFYKPVAYHAKSIMVNRKIVNNDAPGSVLVQPWETLKYQNEKKFVKIIVKGFTETLQGQKNPPPLGQYIVREVKQDIEQLNILQEMYRRTLPISMNFDTLTMNSESDAIIKNLNANKNDIFEKFTQEDLQNKSFHIHNYHAYQKDANSPLIYGRFISIKNETNKIVSIRGNLILQLWKEKNNSLIIMTFGKDKNGIILDENNFVKRGRLSIFFLNDYNVEKYGKLSVFQYKNLDSILDNTDIATKISTMHRKDYFFATLSEKEKKQLKALNLFHLQ